MFSKKDYTVKIKGRSSLLFLQGSKTLSFDIEMMSGQPDIIIYDQSNPIWDIGDESISQDQYANIKQLIGQSLIEKSISFEWE